MDDRHTGTQESGAHAGAAKPAEPAVVGFIGLGAMGAPMAANAQRAGLSVRGYNRSAGKAGALLSAGGTEARSIDEAVTGAALVAVMVPDAPDVERVLDGPDGVLAHAAPGTVVVDFSSIAPEAARRHHALAAGHGIGILDAPVSGGQLGAEEARLSIMVGGEAEHVALAGPLLHAVGRTVRHVGPPGTGQTVKAANQLVVAGHLALLAEAIVFLEAQGVDAAAGVEVLAGGLAGSEVLNQKAGNMLRRSFEPGGRTGLHHKDLGNMLATAREAGVAVPMGALAAELMAAACAQGLQDQDHSVLYQVVARLSGRAD